MKSLPVEDLNHVLQLVPWEMLRDARIFLTGATGFFGAWLLESFCHANEILNLGATAVVLTRDVAAFQQHMPHLTGRPGLTFQEGDVRDFSFPDGTFTHVVHAATNSSSVMPAREMFDVVMRGTRRVLECAESSGAGRLLLVSSGASYGPQPRNLERLPEDYRGAPDPLGGDAYANGKRAAEALVASWQGGFEVVIARAWALVGPRLPLNAHFAAGNFLRDTLAGETIRISGDGTPMRSYLYMADLAVWLWTLLVRGDNGRAYNVGSDDAVSIAELARRCAALRDPAPPVHIAGIAPPGELPARYVPDVSRARSELGLDVRISLDEALHRTFQWLQ